MNPVVEADTHLLPNQVDSQQDPVSQVASLASRVGLVSLANQVKPEDIQVVELEHNLKVQDIPVEDLRLHSLKAVVQEDQDRPVDQMINIQDHNPVVTQAVDLLQVPVADIHPEDQVDFQLQAVELLADLLDNLVDSFLQEDRDQVLDSQQLQEGQANKDSPVDQMINILDHNQVVTQAADLLQARVADIHQEALADSQLQAVEHLADLADNLVDYIHQQDRDQVLDFHQRQQGQANLVNPVDQMINIQEHNPVDTQVADLADFHQLPVV